jgi:hypothetical protein
MGLYNKVNRLALNSETVAATTSATGIWVLKIKPFTVQAVREIKLCIYKVKEAF